jgi:phosphodiesterase/alkaline phosphatase D-like protein
VRNEDRMPFLRRFEARFNAVFTLVAGCTAAWGQTSSPLLGGVWSGNVTPTSVTVAARLNAAGQRVRLAVSPSEQLTEARYSAEAVTAAAAGNAVLLDVTGLTPGTQYHYGLEVGGVLRTEEAARGKFRTFPAGAGSFKLALLGDGDYRDPDQRSYDEVRAEEPMLLLFNGDLHYRDTNTTNPDDYRAGYGAVLAHPQQGRLFRSASLAYVWDDHDFAGGNDSNGTALGAAAARTAYADSVPHYPLRVGDGTIGQALTVGRVRIIITDTRSAAVPSTDPETPAKTRLGAAQKAWFKQELIGAREAGFPLILWMTSDPWIGPAALGDDSWAGYATERTEIADFLKDNRIRNLVIYGGDMHAIAYDDGTHSDYATGGGAPLIVLHAAPLTRDPNSKGGPYAAGPFLGRQQYGILEVTDNGGSTIQCEFSGKRVGEGAKVVLRFTASASAVTRRGLQPLVVGAERALVNVSSRGRIDTPTETVIVGFVVGGRTPRDILMRAVGPSLAAFGVTDALPQPRLALYRGSTLLATNENWGLQDAALLTAVFDRVGAFRLADPGSRDAAFFLNLVPGAYTLQASSLNGALGSVVVEAYEVP